MNKIKKTISLALILVFCFFLVSCGLPAPVKDVIHHFARLRDYLEILLLVVIALVWGLSRIGSKIKRR